MSSQQPPPPGWATQEGWTRYPSADQSYRVSGHDAAQCVDEHVNVVSGVVQGEGCRTVDEGTRLGANSVLVKAVGPESVVVGVPGQVIMRHARRVTPEAPDLDNASKGDHFRNTAGVWESTDFSI